MPALKDSPWWLIISLVVAIVAGNGVIWQYQSARLNKIRSAAEFREREITIYRDILALADSLSRIYAEHSKTATRGELERLRAPIDAQMKMRISDFVALEMELAAIEHRAPRKIPLDFLKPSPPANVHVVEDPAIQPR
jgi:hypothetical protein